MDKTPKRSSLKQTTGMPADPPKSELGKVFASANKANVKPKTKQISR